MLLVDKYRPKKFEDIRFQPSVEIIKSRLSQGKIPHLFIFHGPKGTGKTSTARVLSLSLNCKDRQGIEPCLNCINCKFILGGNQGFLIEVDGASNRGVDDVRHIQQLVRVKTLYWKVVVIDEAHMLTDVAFNALLKTVEEPPEKVCFVLVTTNPFKIISTIRDRAVMLPFLSVNDNDMYRYIKEILEKENKLNMLDSDIVEAIIKSSQGSIRSLLKNLDTALEFPGNRNDLIRVLSSYASEGDIHSFIVNIFSGKLSVMISNLYKLRELGMSPLDILVTCYSEMVYIKLGYKFNAWNDRNEIWKNEVIDYKIVDKFLTNFYKWFDAVFKMPSYKLLECFLLELRMEE